MGLIQASEAFGWVASSFSQIELDLIETSSALPNSMEIQNLSFNPRQLIDSPNIVFYLGVWPYSISCPIHFLDKVDCENNGLLQLSLRPLVTFLLLFVKNLKFALPSGPLS